MYVAMTDAQTLHQIAAHLRAGNEDSAEQMLHAVTRRRRERARACWMAPVWRARRFDVLAELAESEDAQGAPSSRAGQ